jgi:hypothetical protein
MLILFSGDSILTKLPNFGLLVGPGAVPFAIVSGKVSAVSPVIDEVKTSAMGKLLDTLIGGSHIFIGFVIFIVALIRYSS